MNDVELLDDHALMQLVDQELQDFEYLTSGFDWLMENPLDDDSDSFGHWDDLHREEQPPRHQVPDKAMTASARSCLVGSMPEQLTQLQSQAMALQVDPRVQQDWKARAYHELLARLRAEAQHRELVQLVGKHAAIARQIRRILDQRVHKDKVALAIDAKLRLRTNASKRLQSGRVQCFPVDPSSGHLHECVHLHTWYLWLLQRIEWSSHQVNAVFERAQFPVIPVQVVTSLEPWHQLEYHHGQGNDGNSWVEMVVSTVTCLDEITLLDLLWQCFSLKKSKPRKPTNVEKAVVDPIKQQTVGDTIHWDVHLEASYMRRRASVQKTSILKRLQGAFVSQRVGRVRLQCHQQQVESVCSQMDFCHSAWYRVQPLPDGRSVIHHLHRIQSLDGLQMTDPQCQHRMQLLTSVMERAHSCMAHHCKRMILARFLSRSRRSGVYGRGWPLDGDLF